MGRRTQVDPLRSRDGEQRTEVARHPGGGNHAADMLAERDSTSGQEEVKS